jgi:alpha-N-arabinofuranosidase
MVLALCGLAIRVSAQSNTLTVNIPQATYKIERAIYGHLLENLGRDIYNGVYVGTNSTVPNTDGFRKDIIQAFSEEGMSCLEWPGGCASVGYHWKDGIGPKASRPGGDMTNGVGTAEYFELCSMINSIPYITCSIHNTVQEMTGWLNHIDSTPAWKNSLKYWKMGNEEFGGCSQSNPTVYNFIANYKQYVAGIPASYANNLIRIADAGTDPSWASVVLDSLKGKMEAISYHYYSVDWGTKGSSETFNDSLYYKQLSLAWGLEAKLQGFESVLNTKDPNNTVGIMVDEWGAWYDALNGMGWGFQQSTVRDAVLTVMSLNIFNNHCKRVKMALAAQAVNVLASSLLTQATQSTALVKTPEYYVLKMLQPHQNAKMIPVNLTCGNTGLGSWIIPVLSASASIDSTNSLHISLGNNHSSASQTLSITLSGASTNYSQVSGQIVNGPSFTSYNDFNKAETVTLQDFPSTNFTLSGTKLTVTLPAHSAIMLTLPSPTLITSRNKERPRENWTINAFGGKIVVKATETQKMPIWLTLYTADGRRIAEMIVASQKSGPGRIDWTPGINKMGTGIYIVNVLGAGVSESQRIVVYR